MATLKATDHSDQTEPGYFSCMPAIRRWALTPPSPTLSLTMNGFMPRSVARRVGPEGFRGNSHRWDRRLNPYRAHHFSPKIEWFSAATNIPGAAGAAGKPDAAPGAAVAMLHWRYGIC